MSTGQVRLLIVRSCGNGEEPREQISATQSRRQPSFKFHAPIANSPPSRGRESIIGRPVLLPCRGAAQSSPALAVLNRAFLGRVLTACNFVIRKRKPHLVSLLTSEIIDRSHFQNGPFFCLADEAFRKKAEDSRASSISKRPGAHSPSVAAASITPGEQWSCRATPLRPESQVIS